MHRWLESKRNPKWSDVAALCEDTGYNQISESLYNAYYTGECLIYTALHHSRINVCVIIHIDRSCRHSAAYGELCHVLECLVHA